MKSLSINGSVHPIEADAERSLLSVLRDDLRLTGTKYGCGEAQCGACVVIVDGEAMPSCITSVGEVQGKTIETIEGLVRGGELHPVQQAFIEAGAMQCGYCTSGMIMEAVTLLRENPTPDDATIIRVMDRHLCRCGTYARIIKAIRAASEKMSGGDA